MKTKFLFLVVLFFSEAFPQTIQDYELDPTQEYTLKVPYKAGQTTVMFPRSFDLRTSRVAVDPKQKGADFLLSYNPGQYFFSVRALSAEAKDTFTVIMEGKIYVLHVMANDDQPNISVTFQKADIRNIDKRDVPAFYPSVIKGFVDKAKNFDELANYHRGSIQGIDRFISKDTWSYKGFKVDIDQVFRFKSEDIIVFKAILKNYTDKPIIYYPERTAAMVVDTTHRNRFPFLPQKFIDASGVMPPGSVNPDDTSEFIPSKSVIWFAIQGRPDGGRNNFKAENIWNVLIVREPEKEVPQVFVNETTNLKEK